MDGDRLNGNDFIKTLNRESETGSGTLGLQVMLLSYNIKILSSNDINKSLSIEVNIIKWFSYAYIAVCITFQIYRCIKKHILKQ